MELRQLQAVVAIGEEGSFSAAASRLHLAQSGLSQHIKRLEDELGTALFVRQRTGVCLTQAGEEVVRAAQAILMDVEAVKDRVRTLRSTVAQLRIACHTGVLRNLMPEVVARLRHLRPDTVVSLVESHMIDVIAAIRRSELDVGIILGPVRPAGLEQVPLYTDDMVLLVRRDSPLAPLSDVRLARLAHEPLILYPWWHTLRQHVDGAFRRQKLRPQVCLETADVRVICQAVRDGLGAGIVTATFAAHNAGTDLCPVRINERSLARRVDLICRPDFWRGDGLADDFLSSLRTALHRPGAVQGKILLSGDG